MARLKLTLAGVRTGDVTEHPADPFNHDVELYQTWQLRFVDPLVPSDARTKLRVRHGASSTGGAYGVRFKDSDKLDALNDPDIDYDIDEAFDGCEELSLRWDVHWWNHENPNKTLAIKRIFSDAGASSLLAAWEKGGIDETTNVLSSLVDVASPLLPKAIAAPLEALDGITRVIDDYKDKLGDDYWSAHGFTIDLSRKAGKIHWRVDAPGRGEPKVGPGTTRVSRWVVDPLNRSVVLATYDIRVS